MNLLAYFQREWNILPVTGGYERQGQRSSRTCLAHQSVLQRASYHLSLMQVLWRLHGLSGNEESREASPGKALGPQTLPHHSRWICFTCCPCLRTCPPTPPASAPHRPEGGAALPCRASPLLAVKLSGRPAQGPPTDWSEANSGKPLRD